MNLNNLGIALNDDCWLWFPRGSYCSWELPKQVSLHLQLANNLITSHSGKLYVCYPKEKEKLWGMATQLIWCVKTTSYSVKLQWLTTAESLVPRIQRHWKFSMWFKYTVTYAINTSLVPKLYDVNNSCSTFQGAFAGFFFFSSFSMAQILNPCKYMFSL